MQISTRHTPSFGVARCALGPNEPVKIEAGAMMAMAGVVLEAKAEGGILKSLKRAALGGESFFVTTAHASPQGGWIDVAGAPPRGPDVGRTRRSARHVRLEGFVARVGIVGLA